MVRHPGQDEIDAQNREAWEWEMQEKAEAEAERQEQIADFNFACDRYNTNSFNNDHGTIHLEYRHDDDRWDAWWEDDCSVTCEGQTAYEAYSDAASMRF